MLKLLAKRSCGRGATRNSAVRIFLIPGYCKLPTPTCTGELLKYPLLIHAIARLTVFILVIGLLLIYTLPPYLRPPIGRIDVAVAFFKFNRHAVAVLEG